MLFLMSRAAKGLNRRARIFEFVTVLNSQKSQTNTGLIRQPATEAASATRQSRAAMLCSRGRRGRLGAGLRGHRGWMAGWGLPGAPCPPRARAEGTASVFIIHCQGGKGDAVALEECAKWGEKIIKNNNNKKGSSGAHRIQAAPRCCASFLSSVLFKHTQFLP